MCDASTSKLEDKMFTNTRIDRTLGCTRKENRTQRKIHMLPDRTAAEHNSVVASVMCTQHRWGVSVWVCVCVCVFGSAPVCAPHSWVGRSVGFSFFLCVVFSQFKHDICQFEYCFQLLKYAPQVRHTIKIEAATLFSIYNGFTSSYLQSFSFCLMELAAATDLLCKSTANH